jgi:hypothetical protein
MSALGNVQNNVFSCINMDCSSDVVRNNQEIQENKALEFAFGVSAIVVTTLVITALACYQKKNASPFHPIQPTSILASGATAVANTAEYVANFSHSAFHSISQYWQQKAEELSARWFG